MMYYLKTDFNEKTVIPEHQIRRIISKDITKDGDKFEQAEHIIETIDGKRFCCARYYTRKIIEVPLGRYLFVEKHAVQNHESDDLEFCVHNVLALEYELASDSMDYEAINGTIINYFVDEVASYASIRSSDCGYLIDMHLGRIMEHDTVAPLTKESLLCQLVGIDAKNYCFDSQSSLEQILHNFSIKIYKKVQAKGEEAK